jgi:TPP-dependent pyruvate/acetoin dehydrogenase alpha subunit
MQRCPLELFQSRLLADGIITAAEIVSLTEIIDADLAAAVRFGKESPVPDTTDLFRHVYGERD